jgi:hypothetical protein
VPATAAVLAAPVVLIDPTLVATTLPALSVIVAT